MSGQFSVGVVIGGMIGSTFRSAMSGTRRALDSLSDTSRRLQERQNALTRATERYGQLGSSRMQHLNSEIWLITCSYRNDFSSSRGWVRATRALTQAQGLLARWFRFQPGEIDALDTDDLEMWLEQAEEQIKSEYGDKS